MFSGASNFVSGVDTAFVLIFGISAIFLVGITAVMLYFVYRYHEKKNPVATEIHGSHKLELLWTIIPTILALIMFWYGWKAWIPVRRPPKDALTITATARMWSFTFDYPNGKSSNVMVVPEGKPVKVNIVATDILHSIFIPAFRIKQDAVPGKDNFVWFIATKVGTYNLFCTEYCGVNHSYMNAEVRVVPPSDYDKWVKEGAGPLSAEEAAKPGALGSRLYETKGCMACHSKDGSKLVGPSFLGLYGKEEIVVEKGTEKKIKADDAYIKTSIIDPNAQIVKGYQPNQMVSYKGQLDDKQIQDLIDFIKTLNAK